jgi:hypothetical protein
MADSDRMRQKIIYFISLMDKTDGFTKIEAHETLQVTTHEQSSATIIIFRAKQYPTTVGGIQR